jgi:hypothetical protein
MTRGLQAPAMSQPFVLARQLSARGGILKVRLDGERVRLSGQAITVLRGEVLV